MKRSLLSAAWIMIVLTNTGCDEKLSSLTGPTPDLVPTLSGIQRTIFSVSDSSGRLGCVGCHTDQGRTPAAGLVLIEGRAYDSLVGRASTGKPRAVRVIPGDPDNSYLVKKLERASDRPLGQGDVGSLFEDLFGFDSGAQIGLEYRYGIMRGTQVGIHRTSNRTIEFFAQHEVKAQSRSFPFTVDALATVDGTNNFRDSYLPGLGAVISRTIAEHAAFYVQPMWVNSSNSLPSELVDDNDSVMIGMGTRLRVRPTVYLTIEGAPRVAGYAPGSAQVGVGLEKRSGGHTFQLTFTNGFGTTIGQLARGARNREDWHLGFSISRKFC